MAATAGAMLGVGGFALSAAVGSIASQAIGMAIGAQDKFSWKGVALSALGGAVTAGVGSLATGSLAGSELGAVMGRAAIGNALTQGIGIVTGVQKKFDWRGVAASAVGQAWVKWWGMRST